MTLSIVQTQCQPSGTNSHFRWDESFTHLNYQVVPQGDRLRVFDTDGTFFTDSFRNSREAIRFVESMQSKAAVGLLLEDARDTGILTDELYNQLLDFMYQEISGEGDDRQA